MLKNFFLSQKKLLNVILRAKLNYMKNVFFPNEMKLFFAMQKTAFHAFELFCREKVILELKCTKSLLWSF